MDQKKILIVDDEEDILLLFQKQLGNEGYEVTTESNAFSAIDRMRNTKYDLLISDICMPEMDGIDLIRECLSLYPDLNIIAITAYGTDERLLKCIELDCFGYVDKPFNWDYMKVLVRKALA